MNLTPKISLTMELEGGTRIVNYETVEYHLTNGDLYPSKKLKPEQKNKIIKSGTYKKAVFKKAIVKKHITLCKEAYDYMISPEVPSWFTTRTGQRVAVWKKLGIMERLNYHMGNIASDNHALRYSFDVLED